ncbi:GNAT family N-acetyltransferase [Microbacterium sp. CFBP9034]|uniref:GNAT family N-acetyltransferase n=1 Tax=Microbacterium sp. CFBP9034 TaxID=3096540 RepID=UPI002A6A4419|nr:GNAT family N-acetyltransferase [Microbacterium sp. CFBP9034]MDY0908598.1 GNAT family N-acetyltransferase [Microbacterium sp. CFBP9034]
MTDATWLPADFEHPLRVQLTDDVHLRPIRAADVDIDMVAVMGDQPALWRIYGEAWGWPPATMTREQDEEDLARHALEIDRHESFNYAVLTAHEDRLLGCVYIDPLPPEEDLVSAEVSWWTVADAPAGVAARLDAFVPAWLENAWPFGRVVFPFNGGPSTA